MTRNLSDKPNLLKKTLKRVIKPAFTVKPFIPRGYLYWKWIAGLNTFHVHEIGEVERNNPERGKAVVITIDTSPKPRSG